MNIEKLHKATMKSFSNYSTKATTRESSLSKLEGDINVILRKRKTFSRDFL